MATKAVNTNLDFLNAGTVTNLTDGVNPQDAATVAQLNSAVQGLAWKDSARVSTPGNINLSAPGATLDGVTMANGDRVLVPNQTTTTQNGIYVFNGAAVPMTRALDADTFNKLEAATILVEEGTSAGATFRQTAVNGVIGTNNVTWTSFGSSAPAATETTAGIAEVATQAETDAGTDDARMVSPLKLANYSGRAKRFAVTIGDGTTTTFTITHNLNSLDVMAIVKETTGNKREVICEVRYDTSVNSLTLVFNSPPALNGMRVVVLA